MTRAADPKATPELLAIRERLRQWRVYDHLRTDQDAPSHTPQIGTRTPTLSSTGADVAAAFQIIREIGNPDALADAIEDAFPGSSVELSVIDGMFESLMHQKGLLRPLLTAELSDGTLRCLLVPLARLISTAAEKSQVIVVSHAGMLVDALNRQAGIASYVLKKQLGETVIAGSEKPDWNWPGR